MTATDLRTAALMRVEADDICQTSDGALGEMKTYLEYVFFYWQISMCKYIYAGMHTEKVTPMLF